MAASAAAAAYLLHLLHTTPSERLHENQIVGEESEYPGGFKQGNWRQIRLFFSPSFVSHVSRFLFVIFFQVTMNPSSLCVNLTSRKSKSWECLWGGGRSVSATFDQPRSRTRKKETRSHPPHGQRYLHPQSVAIGKQQSDEDSNVGRRLEGREFELLPQNRVFIVGLLALVRGRGGALLLLLLLLSVVILITGKGREIMTT